MHCSITLPEYESHRVDAEWCEHPRQGERCPTGLVVNQGEEGQQVGEDIRKAKYHVEEHKLQYGDNPKIGYKSVIPIKQNILTWEFIDIFIFVWNS